MQTLDGTLKLVNEVRHEILDDGGGLSAGAPAMHADAGASAGSALQGARRPDAHRDCEQLAGATRYACAPGGPTMASPSRRSGHHLKTHARKTRLVSQSGAHVGAIQAFVQQASSELAGDARRPFGDADSRRDRRRHRRDCWARGGRRLAAGSGGQEAERRQHEAGTPELVAASRHATMTRGRRRRTTAQSGTAGQEQQHEERFHRRARTCRCPCSGELARSPRPRAGW